MQSQKQVAMLIETSQERGRGLIRGIIRYSRLFGPWDFSMTPGGVIQVLPPVQQWQGDGIIARVRTRKLAVEILERRLPVILLGHRNDQPFEPSEMCNYPNICMANERFGEIAAEYFLSKGFEWFGYLGTDDSPAWSEERCAGFCRFLRQNGVDESRLRVWPPKEGKTTPRSSVFSRWLQALPKPIALLASHDLHASKLTERCLKLGIAIPEEIALLGIDNDVLLCESTTPPLSSISCSTEQAGFQAAALLDQMMKQPGQNEFHAKTIPIEPGIVVERRSTETDHFTDPLVSSAVNYIKMNIRLPINVSDVVQHVKKSRKSLEVRFKAETGVTIHDMIVSLKLQQVKRFLLESSLSLNQIAEYCGFNDNSYMGYIFKKENGITPDQWRKKHQVLP